MTTRPRKHIWVGTKVEKGPAPEPAAVSPRLSRVEAAIDVPREDDLATTSSTHTDLGSRREEEPSEGPAAERIDGSA